MKKLFIAAAFLLLTASFANAEEMVNFYEVKEVPITQQGDNLAVMRDKAITEGQRKAMDMFQQRLVARKLISDVRNVSDSQINEAIDSIEVRDEKIFTRSYRAKLNVTFSPRVITRIFNVAYVKPTPLPDKYLVIPIMNDSEGTKIWRHKWWDTMQKVKSKNITLPLGDLEDVRSFTREDYSVRDFRNLLKLQKKYNTTAILIAVAEHIPSEKSITLNLERIKNSDVETYHYDIIGRGSVDETQLLAMAANRLVKKVDANNFEDNPLEEEEELKPVPPMMEAKPKGEALTPLPNNNLSPAPAVTPYQQSTPRTEGTLNSYETPQEVMPEVQALEQIDTEPQLTDIYVIAQDLVSWGRIRQKITSTELIENIRIKSFTAGRAFITLTHRGSFADIVTALEKHNLQVSRGTKYWEVKEK